MIPINSVIYKQEEAISLLDLVSLSKEDIFEIESEEGDKIKKSHARKLQHLTWWYVDEAVKYPHNQIPDEFWFTRTSDDFDHFKRVKVPFMSRQDISVKSSMGNQESDSEALALWNRSLKLDVNSFPEFKGQLEKWLPFKRKFLATSKTHELDVLFEEETPDFIAGSQAATTVCGLRNKIEM